MSVIVITDEGLNLFDFAVAVHFVPMDNKLWIFRRHLDLTSNPSFRLPVLLRAQNVPTLGTSSSQSGSPMWQVGRTAMERRRIVGGGMSAERRRWNLGGTAE